MYLEVRVPDGMMVDQVELFLATRACDDQQAGFDCRGIVPPSGRATRDRVEGEVYFVDNDRPFVSTPENGAAWFQLEPNSEIDIKTAIAVGRDPMGLSGVAIFSGIELDRTQHIRLDLEGVTSETLKEQPRPAVELWGPPNNDYRCVAAAVDDRVVYIVPEDDPDCDQVIASNGEQECLPGVYLGSEKVSPDVGEQTCATSENTGFCVLGGHVCDEQTPDASSGTCISNPAATYCVPDAVCLCDTLDASCLDTVYGGTHVVCTIEVESDGGGGVRSCRDKDTSTADLGGNCGLPTIAALDDGFAGFAPATTVQVANNDVPLQPFLEQGGCQIGLVAPNTQFEATPLVPTFAFVKVELTDPGAPFQRSMIMPVKIVFKDTVSCETGLETRCLLVADPGEHLPECFPPQ